MPLSAYIVQEQSVKQDCQMKITTEIKTSFLIN